MKELIQLKKKTGIKQKKSKFEFQRRVYEMKK